MKKKKGEQMFNQTVQKIYLLGTGCQSLSYVIFSDEFNFQIRIRYIETALGNMNQKNKQLRNTQEEFIYMQRTHISIGHIERDLSVQGR